jgi:Dolichyl-phosphate-mannose-protein mannosyltransferase
VAALWFEFTHPANGDTAWFLYMSRAGLHGARLYRDLIDLNPPTIVWLGMPVVWLADLVNLPVTRVFAAVVVLLLFGSACWWASLYRRLLHRSAGLLAMVSAAAVLLFSVSNLTQRDTLVLLGLWPWALTSALRAEGEHLSMGELLGVGLAAGIAIALKPPYLLVPLALVMLPSQPRPWRDPAWWVLALVGLTNVLAVLRWAPDYIPAVRTFAPDYYGYHRLGFVAQLLRSTSVVVVLSLVLLLGARLRLRDRAIWAAWRTTAVMLGALLVQGKGMPYQAVPAFIAAALTAILAFARSSSGLPKAWAAAALSLLLVSPMGFPAFRFVARPVRYEVRQAALRHAIEREAPTGTILIVSPALFDIWPLILDLGRPWPLAVPCAWLRPSNRTWPWFVGQVRRAVQGRPALIFARRDVPDPVYASKPMDQLRWMRADSVLGPALVTYDSLPDVGPYAVLRSRSRPRR